MIKLLYFLIVIILLSIVVVLGAFNLRLLKNLSDARTAPTSSVSNSAVENKNPIRSNKTIEGVLETDNPYLSAIAIRYSFNANLTSIKESPDGDELVTNVVGKDIPKFILKKDTLYFTSDKNGLLQQTNRQALQEGQKIRIHVEYNTLTKQFNLIRVTILI